MTTLTKETLDTILKSLATERPRFCSEADFQFALGWKIQQEFPQAEIRFECPAKQPDDSTARTYIDIVVKHGDGLVPIELKWKLKAHRADPINRGMMLHDIERLEELQLGGLELSGLNFAGTPKTIEKRFAVWLSDNDRFWNENSKNNILDYNGHTISWESYTDDFKYALIDVLQ